MDSDEMGGGENLREDSLAHCPVVGPCICSHLLLENAFQMMAEQKLIYECSRISLEVCVCVNVCDPVCVVLFKVIQCSREVKKHPSLTMTMLEVVVEVGVASFSDLRVYGISMTLGQAVATEFFSP